MRTRKSDKPNCILAAIFSFILLWPVTTASQELLRGTVSANRLAALDRSEAIAIHFRKDAEMNDRLASVAIRVLTDRQFLVSPNGPLEFMIETEIEDISGARQDLEIKGGGGNRSGKSIGVQGRIAGNARKPVRELPQYRVSMTLQSPGSAQIWWGNVTATFNQPNREAAFGFLIERLAGEVGRSFQNKRIEDD